MQNDTLHVHYKQCIHKEARLLNSEIAKLVTVCFDQRPPQFDIASDRWSILENWVKFILTTAAAEAVG